MLKTSLPAANWTLHLETPYARIFTDAPQGILLCEVTKEYIPITVLKTLFGEMSALVKADPYQKFIFDKRALTAFHQPSMEWYYVEWKTAMAKQGLCKHRKLLPAAAWFRKTVEIARNSIQHKLSPEVLSLLDIKYCESLEEAIAE